MKVNGRTDGQRDGSHNIIQPVFKWGIIIYL